MTSMAEANFNLLEFTTLRVEELDQANASLRRQLAQQAEDHAQNLARQAEDHAQNLQAALNAADELQARLDAADALYFQQTEHNNALNRSREGLLTERSELMIQLDDRTTRLQNANQEAVRLRTENRRQEDEIHQLQNTLRGLQAQMEELLEAQNSAHADVPPASPPAGASVPLPAPASPPAGAIVPWPAPASPLLNDVATILALRVPTLQRLTDIASLLGLPAPASPPAGATAANLALPAPDVAPLDATAATEADKQKIRDLEQEANNAQFIIEGLQEDLNRKTAAVAKQAHEIQEQTGMFKDLKIYMKQDKEAHSKELKQKTAEHEKTIATYQKELRGWQKACNDYTDRASKALKAEHLQAIQTLEGEHAKAIQTLEERLQAVQKGNVLRDLQARVYTHAQHDSQQELLCDYEDAFKFHIPKLEEDTANVEQAAAEHDLAARQQQSWQNVLAKLQTQQEHRKYFIVVRLQALQLVKSRHRSNALEETCRVLNEQLEELGRQLQEDNDTLAMCSDELEKYQELANNFRWSLCAVDLSNPTSPKETANKLGLSGQHWYWNIAIEAYKNLSPEAKKLAKRLWGEFQIEWYSSGFDATSGDDLAQAVAPFMELLEAVKSPS